MDMPNINYHNINNIDSANIGSSPSGSLLFLTVSWDTCDIPTGTSYSLAARNFDDNYVTQENTLKKSSSETTSWWAHPFSSQCHFSHGKQELEKPQIRSEPTTNWTHPFSSQHHFSCGGQGQKFQSLRIDEDTTIHQPPSSIQENRDLMNIIDDNKII